MTKARKHPDGRRPPDLLATAMHDLRQPIQSMLLLARVVAQSGDAAVREKGARYMETSLLNLQAMLELLSRLSQLESGAASPVSQRCDLADTLARLEPDLTSLAAAAGRHLAITSSQAAALCDPSLLDLMIRGLVGYGARYASGDVALGCESRGSKSVVTCRFRTDGGPPRKGAFIEPPLGRAGEGACFDPIPGLSVVERLAAIVEAELAYASAKTGMLEITLALKSAS